MEISTTIGSISNTSIDSLRAQGTSEQQHGESVAPTTPGLGRPARMTFVAASPGSDSSESSPGEKESNTKHHDIDYASASKSASSSMLTLHNQSRLELTEKEYRARAPCTRNEEEPVKSPGKHRQASNYENEEGYSSNKHIPRNSQTQTLPSGGTFEKLHRHYQTSDIRRDEFVKQGNKLRSLIGLALRRALQVSVDVHGWSNTSTFQHERRVSSEGYGTTGNDDPTASSQKNAMELDGVEETKYDEQQQHDEPLLELEQDPSSRCIVWGNCGSAINGNQYHHHVVALAQEKAAECMILQRVSFMAYGHVLTLLKELLNFLRSHLFLHLRG